MTDYWQRRLLTHAWRRIVAAEDDTRPTACRTNTDAEGDTIRREALNTITLRAIGDGFTANELDRAELALRRAHATTDTRDHLLDAGRLFLADQDERVSSDDR
ncbi:hypothetical protein [Mycolicibacterium iranicum]|uniref:ANTAR domain-containing protein n=1 Tax=Mycolicibacterium iranicum TaxID=912594 RepID=A0ABT4HQ21_MYCIR|nr:hypothetical protein [Mycolicibacterium iranicum]MCZ0732322.1 hypothetical protein [Mycolicibacterium iranicum]